LAKNSTQEADSSASSRFGEFNMAWYAYCLTEHQTLPNGTRTRRPFLLEGVQGVNGAAVLSYPSGEFAVIVSEYDHAAGELDQKAAIEHARVVSNCFRNSTVLPFKFGTIFDSDDALRQAVRVNRRAFGQSVAKLRGKSEMHIKLVVRDGSLREAMIDIQLPDTVGGDYLSKLRVKASRERERQTKARALSVQVHKLFNPLEEEVSCKKVAPEGMLIDIAHLIDNKSVEKYQNRYNTAAKQLKNCEVSVSGPWPPYHFLPGKLRTVAGNS
jgi:hypothetical protein